MPNEAVYKVWHESKEELRGILTPFYYPLYKIDNPVLLSPKPPFFVLSSKINLNIKEAEAVFVISGGQFNLNSVASLIELLEVTKTVSLNQKEKLSLFDLPFEEALTYLKIRQFFKIPFLKEKTTSTVFKMFEATYKDSFSILYRLWREGGLSYQIVVSSFITMFGKVNSHDTVKSLAYVRVLKSKRPFLSSFVGSVVKYFNSSKTEGDFLRFLFELSGTFNERIILKR